MTTNKADLSSALSFLLYQTEDGQTRVQCRLEDETLWLTQAQMAELFQTSVPNINAHLKSIYDDGELQGEATIKNYLIVRSEGDRSVSRDVKHYRLEAILAVGFRVRSHRGTQFRKWATERLREYLVKGFTLDDQRLKNPSGPGEDHYFEELLARIRDIRSSEKVFYRKVLDTFSNSQTARCSGTPARCRAKRRSRRPVRNTRPSPSSGRRYRHPSRPIFRRPSQEQSS